MEGVEDAMKRKDYEQAAQHIHRYLSFDPALLADNLEMYEMIRLVCVLSKVS